MYWCAITVQEFVFVKSFCDSGAVRLLLRLVLSVQGKLILCSWDYLLCRWTECLSSWQYFLQHHLNCTCVLKAMGLCSVQSVYPKCWPDMLQTMSSKPMKAAEHLKCFLLHNMPKGLLFSQHQSLRSQLPKAIWSQRNSALAITSLVPEGG